jgi:hypothetical protein
VLEFDAGIFGCEVPIGFGMVAVAVARPRCDLRNECLVVGDTAIEALRGQSAMIVTPIDSCSHFVSSFQNRRELSNVR